MKSVIKKKWHWMACGALMACLGCAQVAHADLLLTAESVTAPPGSVNDLFNVYLTNLGATAVDVESFSFEINTTSSDITFEEATDTTTLYSYIFAGNSFVSAFFGGVVSTSSPGQTLDASDLTLVPSSFTVVNPGASFGLGLVSFNVTPGAPNQVAPVNFNTNSAFTSVSDQNGSLLPLEFASGSITVPEPGTGMLLLAPLAGLIWAKGFRRSSKRRL